MLKSMFIQLKRGTVYLSLPVKHMSSEPPTKILKMTNVENITGEKVKRSDSPVKAKKVEVVDSYQFNDISEDGSKLLFKKLTSKATTPLRATKNAAGFDLFSAEELTIPAGERKLIKTDIAIAIPKGSYGRIAPRSGLTYKNGLDVGAGVIDYDYRGNVGVILFNHSKVDFKVEIKLKIAQLVLEKIFMPSLEEVEELDETERGAGGFGSTGR